MVKIATRKSIKHTGARPVIMYDALALIFAINTLLGWIECTYSNPMHPNYFKYLAITDHISAKLLLIVAFVISIGAACLHYFKVTGNSYISYLVLWLDILAITYALSFKFVATNNLVLLNAMLALVFLGLGLTYYFSKDTLILPKIFLVFGIVAIVITAILAIAMHVNIRGFIVISILIAATVLLAYIVQVKLSTYITNSFSSNLQAIFHLPYLIYQALRTR